MNIKEIFDDEKWTGSYDSTYQHSDGHTAEVLYSAHNYSIDRLEQAVADHVSYMEAQLEAYRHANGSKADRIQKMKEQHEEAARSWKQHITELEEHVTAVRAASDDVIASKDKRIAELENLISLAEENRRFHRANVEKSTDGSLNICWGEHEKWEDCEYVRYYPEQRIAESPPVAGSETEPEPEPDFTGRVAELEAALKLAMDWLEDDVPKHIVDKLINTLR